MTEKLDIQKILACLPHRFPFIMVDRVLEVESGKSIRALKNITINEPYFTGHFPEEPVMPGVMILEAIAQAALIMVVAKNDAHKRQVYYLASVDKARFRKKVVPGDQLILEVTLERTMHNLGKFSGRATVDGEVVAETTFMCVMPNG